MNWIAFGWGLFIAACVAIVVILVAVFLGSKAVAPPKAPKSRVQDPEADKVQQRSARNLNDDGWW